MTNSATAQLATPEQLADYLQLPVKTLAEWRSRGVGPRYIKPGGRHVRYDWTDVRTWIASQQRETAAAAGA